jgi:hypothetical protein
LKNFEYILKQVQYYTNIITFHIFGDPLVLKNLSFYLDLASKYNLKVKLVTTGYYINNFNLVILLHNSIKQINFSLNSYNKNNMRITLYEYLEPMITLSKMKVKKNKEFFINFRLWNIDNEQDINHFNKEIYKILGYKFKKYQYR